MQNYKENESVPIPEGFKAMPERFPGRCDFRSEKDLSGFGVAPLLTELCKRLQILPLIFPVWSERHEFKETHLAFVIFNCENCVHWTGEAETCKRDKQGYRVAFGNEKCMGDFLPKILPWQENGGWFEALVNRIRKPPVR